MPTEPQDHRRSAAETANERFEFKWEGEVYTLPPAKVITGGMIRRHRKEDVLDMAFSILEEIAEIDEDTKAALGALDDMPAVGDKAPFNRTLADWGKHVGIELGK